MSKDLHPLELAIEDSRNTGFWGDTYRKPSHPEFDDYSSSPARSSSPPSTPHSSRRDPGYTYIRSSPGVAVDPLYKQRGVGYWGRPTLSSKFSSPYASGSSIYDDDHYSIGRGFQEDAYTQFLDSDGPRNDSLSDSEEDMEDAPHVRSDDSSRTTFFRVSAERGLWKSDPIPLRKTTPLTLQVRKSVPTFSRLPTPLPITIRTVSEPAPSNNSQMTGFYPEKEGVCVADLADPMVADAGEPPSPFTPSHDSKPEGEISSPSTLPSLIPDAESSEGDLNIELDAPSSPLPPSSPPLSPLSRSISIISRSSSPVSFVFEGSSSPLSELSDDDSDYEERFALIDTLGMQFDEQTIIPSLKAEDDTKNPEHASDMQTSCRELLHMDQDLSPSKPRLSPLSNLDDPLAFSPTPVPIISNVKVATLPREFMALDSIDSDDTFPSTFGPTRAISDSLQHITDEEKDVETTPNLSFPVPSTEIAVDDDSTDPRPSRGVEKSSALKDKNGVLHRASNTAQPLTSSSRKARERERKEQISEGRSETQNNVARDDVKSSDMKVKKVNGKKRMNHDDEEDVENDGSSSAGGSRHKRMKRVDGDNVISKSTKRIPKAKRRTVATSGGEIEEPLDAEAQELHGTVCGLVIETMATSRASSLPASSIFKLVMSSQPSLKSQRSEQDWLRIFERVLRDGAADRGSGVFGKVESSGKDASDRPLEAQWFYVPERDQDQERAALIRSMMPRPGKRTETMKYKQYYWRPLERISKWDPEDAL